MLRLLRDQVLYFKCGCAARVVIIVDFSYMHTIPAQINSLVNSFHPRPFSEVVFNLSFKL